MPIPTYDALMLPVLLLCNDKVWQMQELVARLADDLKLTQEERSQQLPAGGSTVISSRITWAKTYLKQAGLLEQPERGFVRISTSGRSFLETNPSRIDIALLQKFDSFRDFQSRSRSTDGSLGKSAIPDGASSAPSSTPEEQIESAARLVEDALRDTLLARILECTPAFFEQLIVDLLLKMRYGGSRTEAGKQLGRTGDGGIDGVINEDELGLDRIYLQAKRYSPGNTVGSEAVQAFIGALIGRGAQKGVFITTSTFSRSAITAAAQLGALRLVLIDGDDLTRLMVRFGVGVRVAQTIELKRVNLDYFETGDTE